MNNSKKAKNELVENFFSEGVRWMALGANESRE
jgi:hypothetical protein